MLTTDHRSDTDLTRLLVVDDHPLIREGIRTLVEDVDDLEVCAVTGELPEAIRLAEQERPDLVLVDLALGKADGMDLIRQLRSTWVGLRMLVVSARDPATFAPRCLQAGAHGFVSKEETMDHVVTAIRAVRDGETYLSPRVKRAMRPLT
jgi:DNA-binding NarL/FixJ family response regulator